MSKKLHLICNAHLDPVWQWEWEEGAAEALSTFRIAADFCEEYDKFVFCHNEAILYKWIEEYDMPLFEKIVKLVKQGKWHIMGGWHVQPDCNMPSGESFVRQILSGRKYFLEKFGVAPKVGVNVDPFGHTRGLVQIMKKSGYDGYLFMRPCDDNFTKLPQDEFKWVGYDGSEITAIRMQGGYCTAKGEAIYKIRDFIDKCDEDDFFLCLWGIGNHGGGPSKKDLDDIEILTKEVSKDGVELIHSTPEKYIDKVNETRNLPKVDFSLNPWSPGCYTSQIRIKQKHRLCENALYTAEIMASHASCAGLMEYPEKEFAEVIYDLLTVEFHDILPGTSIKPAEEAGIRMCDHALEILSRIKARAFFALASGQKKADEDKIPILAYNPHPYPVSGDIVAEFMLWDKNYNNYFLSPVIYDSNGNILPSQCEKENSTIPLEWRKRVAFHATLEPMSINRFDCAFEQLPKKPVPSLEHDNNYYIFDRNNLFVKINRNTGLVDAYSKNGENFVKENAFCLEVFNDDFDPWYMRDISWRNKIGSFSLLTKEEAQIFRNTMHAIDSVTVIESGKARTIVEAVFGYNSSRAVVKYIISEKEGLRIDIRIIWNEKEKLVKLNIPASFTRTECIGEHAYGREEMKKDMEENISQKYITICSDTKAIAVANNGVYGSSYENDKDNLKITLLRSPSYTAHPVGDRITMPQDRYMPYIDQGERDFSFMLDIGDKKQILDTFPKKALIFNMPPMILSFYPTGAGEKPVFPVKLEGNEITLNTFKKADNGSGYIVRLFNNTENDITTAFEIFGIKTNLSFGAYEIKTLRCDENSVVETDLMENLLD